ncbi:hypothetical protein FGO68_gene4468 [Halteria grandinella]|uniref:Uncharacterized protein n=1 Tax=Halteria grandinella TaxID=5974 RepID=A0A8J8NCT2_HALGN|nr:hypothetical protein FGO68_gene4468 [Halteria grandinella]
MEHIVDQGQIDMEIAEIDNQIELLQERIQGIQEGKQVNLTRQSKESHGRDRTPKSLRKSKLGRLQKDSSQTPLQRTSLPLVQGLDQSRNQHLDTSQQPFVNSMKSPHTNNNLIPQFDQTDQLFPPAAQSEMSQHRKRGAMKSGDLSYMKQRFLHEAVNDPGFIDDLMSNNSQRSKQARFDERPPTVHVRPSEGEEGHNLTADSIIRRKQIKISQLALPTAQTGPGLKRGNTITQKGDKNLSRLDSSKGRIQSGVLSARGGARKRGLNESGLSFFDENEELQINNEYEVVIEKENDIRGDLLQIIHCQAFFIEDNLLSAEF